MGALLIVEDLPEIACKYLCKFVDMSHNNGIGSIIVNEGEDDEMKATGLVRRIDELGRIVIPKELRRQYKISEGDPLEIYVDEEGEVILKKYSAIQDMHVYAKDYAKSLHESTGYPSLITDKDRIVVGSEGTDGLVGTAIGGAIEEAIRTQKTVIKTHAKPSDLSTHAQNVYSMIATPIFTADRDILGAVVLYSNDSELTGFEQKIAETAADFMGKQVDLG